MRISLFLAIALSTSALSTPALAGLCPNYSNGCNSRGQTPAYPQSNWPSQEYDTYGRPVPSNPPQEYDYRYRHDDEQYRYYYDPPNRAYQRDDRRYDYNNQWRDQSYYSPYDAERRSRATQSIIYGVCILFNSC